MGTAQLAQFRSVDDVAAIRTQVRERRERLGMNVTDLAREAGISRDTLGDFEAGTKGFHAATLGKVMRALDAAELEAFGASGQDVPAPTPGGATYETIEFVVEGDFGVKVTVKGPIRDRGELEQSVANIIRSIREGRDDQN